jgi:hypothetical protein
MVYHNPNFAVITKLSGFQILIYSLLIFDEGPVMALVDRGGLGTSWSL